MTEQTDFTQGLHPNVLRMMKAISDRDWETVEQMTQGAIAEPPRAECEHCNDRGWYVEHVIVNGAMRPNTMTCPHCAKGQEIEARAYQGRIERAELPRQYKEFTFATWQRDVSDAEKEGKQLAYMAATWFCQKPGHVVNLAELYGIWGLELEDWRKRSEKNSLVFYGDYGTGKTGLAAAILNDLLERGESCMYIRCRDLIREVQRRYGKQDEPTADDMLRKFQRVPVLLIDEFNIENYSDDRVEIIEDVMRYRYGNMLPTVMTCNVEPGQFWEKWGGRTGDAVMAMAHWILVDGMKLRATDAPVVEADLWYQR